jgi:PKD-like domain
MDDARQDCEFQLGNEHVRLVFSGNSMGTLHQCAKDMPAGRILLIEVTTKKPVRLRRSNIKLNDFRRFDLSSPSRQGFEGYIDDKEGLILKTYKGNILQISYIGSSKDRYLCPAYYETLEPFIHAELFRECAPLAISCHQRKAHAGEQIVVSAEAVDNSSKFHWTVTAGKIVSGQGTGTIVIDSTGLEAQVFTVTVSVDGPCPIAASCSVEILPK